MIAVKRKELKLKLKKAKKEATENDQTEPKTDDQKKTDWNLEMKGWLSEFPGCNVLFLVLKNIAEYNIIK